MSENDRSKYTRNTQGIDPPFAATSQGGIAGGTAVPATELGFKSRALPRPVGYSQEHFEELEAILNQIADKIRPNELRGVRVRNRGYATTVSGTLREMDDLERNNYLALMRQGVKTYDELKG